MRELTYAAALSEATVQAMEREPRLLVMGEGVDDPKGSFGTTRDPYLKFGPSRVMDTPLSEAALTGIATGAALSGFPTLLVHLRCEFALLGMDQLANHAAKWNYLCGEAVPLTVRCIVGRGWGQGAQHSQSFHGMFAQVPGLRVVLPSNAFDAKGLLLAALKDPNPTVFIEHRWLHDKKAPVPEAPYTLPIGQAAVAAEGSDVTCVALSYQVREALEARDRLAAEGISMEVIDARWVRPLDTATILKSVAKTGRLLVTDIGHGLGGFCGEVAAAVAYTQPHLLKAPVARVALPEAPTPCNPELERLYYPNPESLMDAARGLMGGQSLEPSLPLSRPETPFHGPF